MPKKRRKLHSTHYLMAVLILLALAFCFSTVGEVVRKVIAAGDLTDEFEAGQCVAEPELFSVADGKIVPVLRCPKRPAAAESE